MFPVAVLSGGLVSLRGQGKVEHAALPAADELRRHETSGAFLTLSGLFRAVTAG